MIQEARRFFENQRRWVLGVLLVLVANGVLRVGVVMPFRASVRSLDESLASGEQDLAEAMQELDQSLRHARLLDLAEGNVEAIYREELRARRERFAEVNEEIKGVAKKHKLDLTRIKYKFGQVRVSKSKKPAAVERFIIELPLKGSYQDLKQFVSDIETSSQHFFVDSVTLTDSTERGTELNLQISVSTYFWEPESQSRRGREESPDA